MAKYLYDINQLTDINSEIDIDFLFDIDAPHTALWEYLFGITGRWIGLEQYVILDNHMRRVVDLDPEKVISPMTVEDLTSGEHTLQFGYPATGPSEARIVGMTWNDLFTEYGADITWEGLEAAI